MSEKCVHEWYYRIVDIVSWQFFCIRCGEKLSMDKFSNHASDLEKNADALNARIAELEAERRWIPVGERLPEIGVRVLFYNNFIKNIHKGWFSCDEWVSEIGVFYNGGKLKRITHWMPLPKFPEVQE